MPFRTDRNNYTIKKNECAIGRFYRAVGWCKDCVKNQTVNVPSVLFSLIHSVLSPTQETSSVSFRESFTSTVCPFNVKHFLVSFSSSCNCLHILRRLPVPSSLPPLRLAISCFTIQLLSAMFLIMLFFLLSVLYTLIQRFPNCGPRTTGGPRVLPLWYSWIEH
jgi:hypothetical protein